MAHNRDSDDVIVSGRKIRRQRVLAGMSLRAMSKACARAGSPVSFGNLGKIERGLQDPHPRVLKVIATVLEVETEELLEDDKPAAVAS